MLNRISLLTLGLLVVSGCGIAPHAAVAVRTTGSLNAQAADDALAVDVQKGYMQIFQTYDNAPKDNRLNLQEFSHVVTKEWFDAHDTNHDGYILFDEWLTPTELSGQVAAIQDQGREMIKTGDKNNDQQLSWAEYKAYKGFDIDATPWLSGAPDAQIKQDDFKSFASTTGLLNAEQAALMVGDLLARGYYLDDGNDTPDGAKPKLAPFKR